jgi:hypothetical protein
MTHYTDQGTLQLLEILERSASERLVTFMANLQNKNRWTARRSIVFDGKDFIGRDDIDEMKLEEDERNESKLISTVKLKNGALWRRGQLRIPNLVLPEIIKSALKGRKIEEIVENPPFHGFVVTGGVQDGNGKNTKLRLRCTAEKVGEIIINPARQPTR